MLKTLLSIGSLTAVLCLSSLASAQALPTATAHGALQIGVGWSYAEPDYGQKAIQGVSGYADFDFTQHIGVEVSGHYLALETPTDLAENSILVGPRYVVHKGRFDLYGKALFGVGTIDIQEVADNPQGGAGSYVAYGIGGGVDIRTWRHLNIRAIDFEYQHWSYLTGLTPAVFTSGFAYRFR